MSIQYFLIFSYLNPPSKASGIAVALFQTTDTRLPDLPVQYMEYVPELHSLEIQTGRSVLFPDPYICGLPIFLYTAENTESAA